MQFVAKRYDTGEAASISISEGRIASISAAEDVDLPWIAPGFVDLQVNGYGGQEFNDLELTSEKVEIVSKAMDADGVTSYLPTATTHGFEMLSHTMRTLAAACDASREVARRVPGFHLEGPYMSKEDGPRGAHPLEHCRAPDWEEFQRLQEAAGGHIRIVTLSPEYAEAPAFIRRSVDSGVLVAIGHTAATSDQIKAAVDAGASMSTHLGNGAHGQIRRHPNYIWDQLADDRLVASLIVDTHHLPPAVVKCFVRGKTPRRCVLVSDLVGMAGMPSGEYTNTSIGNIEILEDGRIVVAGQRQYMAGAGLPITHGVANMMRFTDVDLKTTIDMASIRPAELIGETPVRLEIGAVADLVLFDIPGSGPAHVRCTINAGEVVYGSPT
ncbi:MAG: N-acetylglucosamine-6-phosphate deacetylase [Planctomycetaceae bacterium]|nr:N-acetylglucosamine-6-phosphate deacetylase [Planctomycetaceae bacterium]